MAENPYQSPDAAPEPGRQLQGLKRGLQRALLLAASSYALMFGLALIVNPAPNTLVQRFFMFFLFPILLVRDFPADWRWILSIGSVGLLLHFAFWTVVLCLWRRRPASD